MKKAIIAIAALVALFAAPMATAQFSSSAGQGTDASTASGSSDGGGAVSEGATSGGR